ncbi:MAG TPA: hypothetical protein VMD59_22085 [Acidimicrobiales bacterium]|nr:hypothetical protein [Acidimicrobiales bacterium]
MTEHELTIAGAGSWNRCPEAEPGVTEPYDLSRAPEWLHKTTSEGEGWWPGIEASLENLAKLVEVPE